MTGDIVYKDLIQLDLDVRNTDNYSRNNGRAALELGYGQGIFWKA